LAAGQPVISVDTKKKELIGNFKNAGQCWCREAEAVNVHDFATGATGKAVPYGIHDLQHNAGYVYAGQSRRYRRVCGDYDRRLVDHHRPAHFRGG